MFSITVNRIPRLYVYYKNINKSYEHTHGNRLTTNSIPFDYSGITTELETFFVLIHEKNKQGKKFFAFFVFISL